jgi:deoxyribonucleoside regulator
VSEQTNRRATVLRAAVMYYEDNRTMDDVAVELGVSRATVSRMVGEARDIGLVEITVHHEARAAPVLERTIKDQFGVSVTVISRVNAATEVERLNHMANQVTEQVRSLFEPHTTVAVAWGATITAITRALTPGVIPGLQVVQLNGSGNTFSSGIEYASGVLERFGAALGARVHLYPVPAFFDRPATRSAMWQERSVQRVLQLQRRADAALFSVTPVGGPVPGYLYRAGYLGREELRDLGRQKVVGDVNTVFIRSDGSHDGIEMNLRSSGMALEFFNDVPRRVCVATGAAKATVLRAALQAGSITDLIVDTAAAEALAGEP